MNVLAIIPARGGSKAIPRKNVVDFGGKPLIAWSIETALASRLVTRTVVSTDDDEISAVAEACGAEVVRRPAAISGDEAASEDALLHVLDDLRQGENYEPDLVLFVQATSPLRDADDFDSAIETLISEQADSLVSVGPFHGFLWALADGSATPVNYDPLKRPRRQDLPAEYVMENGSFFICKTHILRQLKCRLGGKITVYKQSLVNSFEINEPEDLPFLSGLLDIKQK